MVECSAVLQIVQSFCKVSFKLFNRFAKSPFDSRYCLSHFIPVNMLSSAKFIHICSKLWSECFFVELPSNVYDTVIASVWRTLGGEDGDQGALISVSTFFGCCGAGLIWGGGGLGTELFPINQNCLATCEAIRSVETIFHFNCGESNLH